jgi:hypothetical protein
MEKGAYIFWIMNVKKNDSLHALGEAVLYVCTYCNRCTAAFFLCVDTLCVAGVSLF